MHPVAGSLVQILSDSGVYAPGGTIVFLCFFIANLSKFKAQADVFYYSKYKMMPIIFVI
jgi:hypothetical protein